MMLFSPPFCIPSIQESNDLDINMINATQTITTKRRSSLIPEDEFQQHKKKLTEKIAEDIGILKLSDSNSIHHQQQLRQQQRPSPLFAHHYNGSLPFAPASQYVTNAFTTTTTTPSFPNFPQFSIQPTQTSPSSASNAIILYEPTNPILTPTTSSTSQTNHHQEQQNTQNSSQINSNTQFSFPFTLNNSNSNSSPFSFTSSNLSHSFLFGGENDIVMPSFSEPVTPIPPPISLNENLSRALILYKSPDDVVGYPLFPPINDRAIVVSSSSLNESDEEFVNDSIIHTNQTPLELNSSDNSGDIMFD